MACNGRVINKKFEEDYEGSHFNSTLNIIQAPKGGKQKKNPQSGYLKFTR
jgi:hypothetical protein